MALFAGQNAFDFTNNNGESSFGEGLYDFTSSWSRADSSSLYSYDDHYSVNAIALVVPDVALATDVTDASIYNYSSRGRLVNEGGFMAMRNSNGYYAILEIIDIKDKTRGDLVDQLSFKYTIQMDGSSNFSKGDLTPPTLPVAPINAAPDSLHMIGEDPTVIENEPGAKVALIDATDPDSLITSSSISITGQDADYLVIKPSTESNAHGTALAALHLRSDHSADYETKSSYSFNLTVTDSDDLSLTVPFTALVIDDTNEVVDIGSSTTDYGNAVIDGSILGALETYLDSDWYRAVFEDGNVYTINVEGEPTNKGSLADPMVTVYDANGEYITWDDDSGVGYNAQLRFTPGDSSANGGSEVYFIDVSTWAEDQAGGTYLLSIDSSALEVVPVEEEPLYSGKGGDSTPTTPIETSVSNTLYGTSGDDSLDGFSGYDIIDGQTGLDTVKYKVASDRVSFSENDAGQLVIQNSANASLYSGKNATAVASEAMESIERLQFSDKNYALDLDGNAGVAAKAVITCFGQDSLSSYMSAALTLADGGSTVSDICGLVASMGYIESIKGISTNSSFVEFIFENVVGRVPNFLESAMYTAYLDDGVYTKGSLLTLAAGTDLVDQQLSNNAIDLIGVAGSADGEILAISYDLGLG
jgi:hypothetical protein